MSKEEKMVMGKKPQDISMLIVDDEPDICEILSFSFEAMGCRIDTSTGGIEALAKYNQKP